MAIAVPGGGTRWRCAQCGNLTRFDVVRLRRLKEYWHFDLSGEVVVEDAKAIREIVEQVTCRWCGSWDDIEVVPRPDAGGPTSEPMG
jgi:hypothetical protein